MTSESGGRRPDPVRVAAAIVCLVSAVVMFAALALAAIVVLDLVA